VAGIRVVIFEKEIIKRKESETRRGARVKDGASSQGGGAS